MANNPYVNKVVYGNQTLIDISDTTATASDVVAGKTIHTADGALRTGTATYAGSETAGGPANDSLLVNGHTVLSDVPANAVFTDTTYTPATKAPLMDGTAAVGSSSKYAREDHVHPSDTSKYGQPYYGNGTTDIAMRSLVAYARANRLAFLPSDQIIIEKTTDGGTTWVSADYSDAQKKALFATRGASIAIPLLNGAKSTDCGIRITITAMKYNVPEGTAETDKYNYWNSTYVNRIERYSNLREMWFWLSSNSDAIRVQVYRATGANSTNWYSCFDTNFGLTGWSGSDWIRFSGNWTFGGGTNQTGNFWNWRIVFWSRIPDGKTEFQSTTAQTISGINGYGDNVWTTPNGLMKEDHLYTWDADMNAAFPGRVSAPSFSGPLTGNVTGNVSGKVNNHTVNSDVPTNAVFTDTTYESKNAESGGTDVSLVTTGDKYTWNNKLDANLGSANSGKFLIVGSTGAIETVTMAEWQGGSY